MSKTVRYMVLHEVDADLLCDQDTIDAEFAGDWSQFMDWFWEQEKGELICGMQPDKYPPEIRLVTLITNSDKANNGD